MTTFFEPDEVYFPYEDHNDCVTAINRLVDEVRTLEAELAGYKARIAELEAQLAEARKAKAQVMPPVPEPFWVDLRPQATEGE